MTAGYDQAVQALYHAPHEAFVAERKRLAAELKASGDAAGAQRLAKLARPSISAWAVNQLFWHERATFQKMFESAAELRAGKLAAREAHRQAMATLSARARKLLAAGGHAASEGTVRRVEATLAGLAAAGGFAPEPEGALTKDRDPPGFEAFGISSSAGSAETAEAGEPPARAHATHPTHAKTKPSEDSKSSHADPKEAAAAKRREHEAAQRARVAAEAARKREAEARAKREAERRELASAVREAKRALSERISVRERAEKTLATAEREEREARDAVERAEAKLAALSADE